MVRYMTKCPVCKGKGCDVCDDGILHRRPKKGEEGAIIEPMPDGSWRARKIAGYNSAQGPER